jgi:UDP-glucose 4-epimerase
MATAFVTGGAGLIGSYTSHALRARGHHVVVYDSFQQYATPPGRMHGDNLAYRLNHLLNGVEIVRGSTENPDQLRRAIERARPEYVIHLAALPLAGVAIENPEEAVRSIVVGTTNVLGVLRDRPTLAKFVYVSSSMAYGHFVATPLPEDSLKDPIDIYGSMKLAGELIVRSFGRQYGVPYAIVRPSAVYGPADNNQRVVQSLVEKAVFGEPVVVEDPDNTYLDFTYVTDLADGLVRAALLVEAAGEDFNLTFGRARSLSDLVNALRVHVPDLQATVRPKMDTFRPVRGTLDNSKARLTLGFEPKVDLEQGTANYVEYVRSHLRPRGAGTIRRRPTGALKTSRRYP